MFASADPVFLQSLRLFFTVFFGLFGSLLGSFTNVVILRLGQGRSVVFPPSACPVCSHQLSAFDLVPVFSWLRLGGRCRYCSAPISWQYPLVETICACNVGVAFYNFGFSPLFPVNAAWGVILVVVCALWIRGEMDFPAPFWYPSGYFALLSWWGGGLPSIETAAAVLLIAFSAAVMIGLRTPGFPKLVWAGALATGLWSLSNTTNLWWIVPFLLVALQIPLGWESGQGFQKARIPLAIVLTGIFVSGLLLGFRVGS